MKLTFLGDYCQTKDIQLKISQQLKEELESSDIVCINLEGPLINSRCSPKFKMGPNLRQHNQILNNLELLNCSHLSLANNHIMDFGDEGLEETLSKLSNFRTFGAGMSYIDAYSPSIIEKEGKSVALFSFGESQFGVINTDLDSPGFASVTSFEARKQVMQASKSNDFVIVQVHAGLEMCELPLPEWRRVYKEFIYLGADMVIGHHPHILQGKETYLGKSIYYSLGNFFMDSMNNDLQSGGILQLDINGSSISESINLIQINDGSIDLLDSYLSEIELKKLSRFSHNEDKYIEDITDICVSQWNDIYQSYYASSMSGIGTKLSLNSLKKLIFRLASIVFSTKPIKKNSELLLLHNIQIETHRWVVERALNSKET